MNDHNILQSMVGAQAVHASLSNRDDSQGMNKQGRRPFRRKASPDKGRDVSAQGIARHSPPQILPTVSQPARSGKKPAKPLVAGKPVVETPVAQQFLLGRSVLGTCAAKRRAQEESQEEPAGEKAAGEQHAADEKAAGEQHATDEKAAAEQHAADEKAAGDLGAKDQSTSREVGLETPSKGNSAVGKYLVATPMTVDPVARPQTALTPYLAKTPVLDAWQSLPVIAPGPRQHLLSGAPLVDFFRGDPAARAFDLLRTRLLQTLRTNGWNRIAIAAPTGGCGATFIAVNLALSLARIPGSRNVLMDLNHRAPGVAKALEVGAEGDMRGYLSGEVAMESQLTRVSDTLALGLTRGADEDAAEMLHDARCAATLARMNKALRPDVVLYDLPPILAYDDLAAFLPQVDGVLLVSDGTSTQARHIKACERILDGQTQVLGVILNRARRSGLEKYDG